METRKNIIINRFKTAGITLNASPEQIESLKLRENVEDYQLYDKLIRKLVLSYKVNILPIEDNSLGKSYLVSESGEKVIIVEHETGLEILYIAGSIASLLGIIPLIIQAWKFLHKKNGRQNQNHERYNDDETIKTEIRSIDTNGSLREEYEQLYYEKWSQHEKHLHSINLLTKVSAIISEQSSRIELIEERLKNIEKRLNNNSNFMEKPKKLR